MGSGSEAYPELARYVGRLVAEVGCHLLTGGGAGVMAEVSRAFCEVFPRKGICIGILKGATESVPQDLHSSLLYRPSPPNEWVELPVYTHLPLSGSQGREEGSRNHINVLTSDVLVALPGGSGTYSEVTLRLDYGMKVILFLGEQQIDGYSATHFCSMARENAQVLVAGSAAEFELLLRQEIY